MLFTDSPSSSAPEPTGETLSEYLLVCRAKAVRLTEGSWHFALESVDGTPVFSAGDQDFGDLNRLTLLAAVRGLESIDGASSVTLVSSSRYLIRSLADCLPRWRAGGFMWEHFGRRIDVQHADLWRRIDRAVSIHQVNACLVSSRSVSSGQGQTLRLDAAHSTPPAPSDPLRRWLMTDEQTSVAPANRTANRIANRVVNLQHSQTDAISTVDAGPQDAGLQDAASRDAGLQETGPRIVMRRNRSINGQHRRGYRIQDDARLQSA